MARILITTFGSFGDLYPYIAVGIELRRLGHQVTIGTSETYRRKVESEGLGFEPVRPDMSLDDRDLMRVMFDRKHGSERVVREVAGRVRESYDDTLLAARNADAIVTHPITYGSVLVAQKLQLPWISTVLAPISFVSAHDPPVPPQLPALIRLRVFGPRFMGALWRMGKRQALKWIRPVLDLRRELGLPSDVNPVFEGSHSPDLVLALFSRLFAAPQPDWPPQTVITGFPFYDDAYADLAPELESFIADGEPPIVFTLGSSAVGAAGTFYIESLQAIRKLQVRAVFLTGTHPQGLPTTLPRNVLSWPYAPHSQVFARASLIVHQGGIGTTAQALRSGHPELVIPFAHDQFDNAERVRRLRAGTSLPISKYNALTAERILRSLLEGKADGAAAAAGASIRAENGARTAAVTIDNYLRLA